MNPDPLSGKTRASVATQWLMVCLVFACCVGCQAFGKTKKAQKPQDKFSCGEALPGRIP